MENNTFFRRCAVLILALGGLFALWLAMKYALPIALPILVAWALGSLIRPISEGLSRRTHLPPFLCSIILMLLFVALFGLVTVFAANRLLIELLQLWESLGENESVGRFAELGAYLTELTEHIPIIRDIRGKSDLEDFWQGVDRAASDAILGHLENMISSIGEGILRLLSSMPTTLLTLTVTLIATYYFSLQRSRDELTELLPSRAAARMSVIFSQAKTALKSWARAYLLIMLITFAELFVGFSLMGIGYAFLAAAAVAIVDILPILGTGTVLIPWAIIGFLSGDRRIGVGMLLLYGVISLIRQLIEPRLIGKKLGIPPLVSLITMYVGFRLFGFLGMIAAPAVTMLVINKKQSSE